MYLSDANMANPQRQLTIISHKTSQSVNTQYDIKALSGRRPHNISNIDGRHKKIQESILRHSNYTNYINNIIKFIETHDLTRVSFHCKHGHHRSVACAELLGTWYPLAKIIHTNI